MPKRFKPPRQFRLPKPPRLFISGGIYEVCFRTEEGLPLVSTPYMKVILKGIIATAFSMYDVDLLADIVMGNHIHLLVRVINPEHLDDVVCYIKRESAHAINNLLGRRRRTVWQQGYDCPLILDAEKMIDRLIYFFTNPTKANLESTIELYPGLSSWESVLKDGYVLKGRRIPREVIPALPAKTLSLREQHQLAEQLLEEALPEQEVRIDPLSFLNDFSDGISMDCENVRARIIKGVREKEAEFAAERTCPVLGAHALKMQSMRISYEPKKFGKQMWVLSSRKEIRIPVINWFKEQFEKRRLLKLALGPIEFLRHIPPGFFTPGGFLRANLNPHFVPI